MTTIYLIRHAEAEGNLYRRAHGQYDSLITENGYRQIRALAKRFEDISIDVVWSSDLFRTMTTARAILEPKNKTLNTHQGLREINMGVWEDKTWGQLAHDDPQKMIQFSESSQFWQPEHGESFEKLTERIGKTVTDLAKQNDGKIMAIFCHGLAIRQFMAYVNQLSPTEWGSSPHGDNTSVSKLTWDGKQFEVEYSADNSHLSDDISTLARQKWWKKEEGAGNQDRNVWFAPVATLEEETEYQGAMLEVWGSEGSQLVADKNAYQAMEGKNCVGWISISEQGELLLLHLKEGNRRDRIGIQLLGQAVSFARSKGISTLFCHRPPNLEFDFFEQHGFKQNGDIYEFYMGYQPRNDIFI